MAHVNSYKLRDQDDISIGGLILQDRLISENAADGSLIKTCKNRVFIVYIVILLGGWGR